MGVCATARVWEAEYDSEYASGWRRGEAMWVGGGGCVLE